MNFWNDPINFISVWLRGLLSGWGLSDSPATVIVFLIGILVLTVFAMVLDIFLVWIERKVVARFRTGWARTGSVHSA